MGKRTCDVPECSEPHNAKGYCLKHYMRLVRTGALERTRPKRPEHCTLDGCSAGHKGLGLCAKHLARYRRHGDPLAPARGGPGYQTDHGTAGRYEYHGCRCGPCTEAAATARRRWTDSPEYRERRATDAREARKAFSDWLRDMKITSGCVDCGYREHSEALDFDHVRGGKIFNVSRGYVFSREAVEEEIAKCEVVCANCHRVRTKRRRRASHG